MQSYKLSDQAIRHTHTKKKVTNEAQHTYCAWLQITRSDTSVIRCVLCQKTVCYVSLINSGIWQHLTHGSGLHTWTQVGIFSTGVAQSCKRWISFRRTSVLKAKELCGSSQRDEAHDTHELPGVARRCNLPLRGLRVRSDCVEHSRLHLRRVLSRNIQANRTCAETVTRLKSGWTRLQIATFCDHIGVKLSSFCSHLSDFCHISGALTLCPLQLGLQVLLFSSQLQSTTDEQRHKWGLVEHLHVYILKVCLVDWHFPTLLHQLVSQSLAPKLWLSGSSEVKKNKNGSDEKRTRCNTSPRWFSI